ncbi:hypothetical protein GQ42DRAFT_162383 [Ramicandelaber brevisporus]|nr:hypothetical protein GQ42DRAFT_162383 [Ramicandelaber brevisporus]
MINRSFALQFASRFVSSRLSLSTTPSAVLYRPMSSNSTLSNTTSSDKQPDQQQPERKEQPLGIEYAPEAAGAKEPMDDRMRLEQLGPVVVNVDGTISRIDNWSEMSDIEKANVNRILLKRNKQRLAALAAQQNGDDN